MENSYLSKFIGHFKTVHHHRKLVRQMCFKCGMYYQGLVHDLSKYSLEEFLIQVKYFEGFRSPITHEKALTGHSKAWLHHKGRNKHHWEYWIDRQNKNEQLYVFPMPYKYMLESVIDRISASKTYKKDEYTDANPYDFFINSIEYNSIHYITRKQISDYLLYLKENGEEKALAYYKSQYKIHKNDEYFNL